MERSEKRYDGRPGGIALDDFWDWVEAAYWKAASKGKVTRLDFCRQMPAFLQHEALHLWRRKREEILTLPEGTAAKDYDPIEEMVKLFRREFETASPELVAELLSLKRGPGETCRMLKSRLERLVEKTGLLTAKEQARTYVRALPAELRVQLEPVLWVQSPGGEYTLEAAFEAAERLDLARALSARDRDPAVPAGALAGTPVVAAMAATVGGEPQACFRCGSATHIGAACPVKQHGTCSTCGKTGHTSAGCWRTHPDKKPVWAGGKGGGGARDGAGSPGGAAGGVARSAGGDARDQVIAAMGKQLEALAAELAKLKAAGPTAEPAYLAEERAHAPGDPADPDFDPYSCF